LKCDSAAFDEEKAMDLMSYLLCALLIGAGATLLMDLWTVTRQRLLHIPALDYALVGRWLAHMMHGEFRHDSIAAASPMRGERAIGWTAHYATGIAFAALVLGVWGMDWARHPTVGPAMIVGIGSVVAPFFLMQPGMGAGVAASRTRRPAAARLQSLLTHTVFGFGLYVSAWIARAVV
jgi:hypothetical protein